MKTNQNKENCHATTQNHQTTLVLSSSSEAHNHIWTQIMQHFEN